LVLFKATQKLIDRFLFIFFCEDNNGLLPANSIAEIIKHWNNLREMDEYRSLYEIFRKYFEYINTGRPATGNRPEIFAYNGGLFSEDSMLDNLRISDTVLYTHAQKLSGYDFVSEVDVNILGHIFEHSLNDLEELQAELEGIAIDKTKTKRKKDGVFYTPRYITEYIVENTIGKLCVDKKESLGIVEDEYVLATSKKDRTMLNQKLVEYKKYLLSLTICDPACGSGAFLNQAFIFLQKEHQYIADLESKLFDTPLALTDVSADILENNLYGVDINEESVEIARLSLWLRSAKKGRKLNNLSSNIKCGNSLIDDPEVAGDKAFSWEKEFPQVFAKGGFDVVFGNPPYGALLDNTSKQYYQNKFKTFQGNFEIYFFFIELASLILMKSGLLGFITPDTWIKIPQALKLRIHVLENYGINKIKAFNYSVFADASVNAIIFILFNSKFNKFCNIELENDNTIISKVFPVKKWIESDDKQFQIFQTENDRSIIEKIINQSTKGENILDVCQGIVPYSTENLTKEQVKNRIYHHKEKKMENFGPWVQGKAINRYKINIHNAEFLNYGDWLHRPRKLKYFTNERILVQEITGGKPPRISAVTYNDILFHDPGIISCLNISEMKTEYLLSLINSKLFSWFISKTSPKGNRMTFPKVLIGDIRNLPIKIINQVEQLPFIENANKMIKINSDLQKLSLKFTSYLIGKYHLAGLPVSLENWYNLNFTTFIRELNQVIKKNNGKPLSKIEEFDWIDLFEDNIQKALINKTNLEQIDQLIDQMVYELYGLSEEEIKIVENS
jgi:type I restriction-modification system DNA methylase subunit